MNHRQKGFGAIEILVIIVILAVVGTIGYTLYTNKKVNNEAVPKSESSSLAVSYRSREINDNINLEKGLTTKINESGNPVIIYSDGVVSGLSRSVKVDEVELASPNSYAIDLKITVQITDVAIAGKINPRTEVTLVESLPKGSYNVRASVKTKTPPQIKVTTENYSTNLKIQ